MNDVATTTPDLAAEAAKTTAAASRHRSEIEAAIKRACNKIAPLWPLKHFVAVNPFLGFSGQSFHATCATLRRVARADMLMPREFYRRSIAAGFIADHDIEAALASAPEDWRVPRTVAELKAAVAREPAPRQKPSAVVATVADVLDMLSEGEHKTSRTAFMVDEISKWCAAYFDEGQSVWRLPSRGMSLYAAWRASMRYDLNPEIMGVTGFRKSVAEMPADPVEAIIAVVDALGIPERAVEDYLHRSLFDIGGWAAYARYLVWNSELYGEKNDMLVKLLAVRLVWGYALFRERKDAAFKEAWRRAMEDAATLPKDELLGDDPDFCIDMVMQEAYEGAYQRRLLYRLTQPHSQAACERPKVQAAFCIDVRSEVYRRALETVCPEAETIGFAGFFGFPIEYVPIGHVKGGAQCPVLLKPAFVVCEAVDRASDDQEADILNLRLLRRRAAKVLKSFKLSAVSSFIYVETAGLLFAGKIFSDSLGLTRTVNDPNADGLDPSIIERLGPRIAPRRFDGRHTGFSDDEALAWAEAVLRGMSLSEGFARLVMLTGHGSATVNNPHASGLDCGACGGHTGEANARVAAAILNDASVRAGLKARHIAIPEDTWFIGCLHNTTTDEIVIYDKDKVPDSHRGDLRRLRRWLSQASSLARAERAAALGVANADGVDERVVWRSRDWSQVRPEWGLAGNAAFVAARRELTRGIDLGGRAFLHEYDWRQDANFGTLELIMTAPLVVASWINLQYYGSTVNNRVFGSGNKVLHNVTGTIGVLEGNAGDLRVGLPWQSVHDGKRFVHEPVRLNVFIEAPEQAIDAVLAKHEHVRRLVSNGWLHLFAFADDGQTIKHYRRGAWHPANSGAPVAADKVAA